MVLTVGFKNGVTLVLFNCSVAVAAPFVVVFVPPAYASKLFIELAEGMIGIWSFIEPPPAQFWGKNVIEVGVFDEPWFEGG